MFNTFSKIAVLLFFTFLNSQKGFCQMGAAQKIIFDIDSTVNFNVPRDGVWELLKEPSQWNEISNGLIAHVVIKKLPSGMKKEILFADSSLRYDFITQYQPEYRFIVTEVTKPLPVGITQNFFSIIVNAITENTCSFIYRIKVDGDAAAKTQLLAALRKEMCAIIAGMRLKLPSVK